MLISTAVIVGFSLIMAQSILPPGQSIKDIPNVLAQIRHRTPNPYAQNVLDWMLGEERIAAAAREMQIDEARNNSSVLPSTGVGDQVLNQATGRNIGAQTNVAYDPRALEAIERMLVSKELKDQIKRKYLATGQLEGIDFGIKKDSAEAKREPTAAPLNDPGVVWPTRSLSAVVAITAGAVTNAPRPTLENKNLERQADTLLARIHADIEMEKPVIEVGGRADRYMKKTTESLIKSLTPTSLSEISTKN